VPILRREGGRRLAAHNLTVAVATPGVHYGSTMRGFDPDLNRHCHVPEASLVVSHPDKGVLSLARLLAHGDLELAIDRSLDVADVGPEGVGGPPLDELRPRSPRSGRSNARTWRAGKAPAQCSALPGSGSRSMPAGSRSRPGSSVAWRRRGQRRAEPPSPQTAELPNGGDHAPREQPDVDEWRRGRDAGLGAHQGLRVEIVLGQPTVEGVLGSDPSRTPARKG